MTSQVRRVVAANDEKGQGVVVSDERLSDEPRIPGVDVTGWELWSTNIMPVDNAPAADEAQRRGYIKIYNDFNYVGSGQGTTFRITEWPPGHPRFTHRTLTVDYDVVLQGEIDLHLEDNYTVRLKAGDTVVVRGALHAW